MSILLIHNWEELRQFLTDWDDLTTHACEPNAFYESWMLLPALETLAKDYRLQFLLVFAKTEESGARQLCGFFPLERVSRYRKLPMSLLRLWKHPYCMLCTPLIRSGYEGITLTAVMNWLENAESGPALFAWNDMSGNGPVSQHLNSLVRQEQLSVFPEQTYQRAFLQCSEDADRYIKETASKEFLKKLRRFEKRLRRHGRLEYIELTRSEELNAWLDCYCNLELRGWKGRNGSAVSQRVADAAFFRVMVPQGYQKGRLRMLALTLDEVPIAMQINLYSPPGSFAFKTAYDEVYAKNSPGVLLELHNIHLVHNREDIHWMDSCAKPDHPTLCRIWRERRPIQSMLVSSGRILGNVVVSLLPLLRYARQKLASPQAESMHVSE